MLYNFSKFRRHRKLKPFLMEYKGPFLSCIVNTLVTGGLVMPRPSHLLPWYCPSYSGMYSVSTRRKTPCSLWCKCSSGHLHWFKVVRCWASDQLIFKLTLINDGWDIDCEIALKWMSPNLTDDKSTLVQVTAWCPQATSHYLSQCWPRSMLPLDVNRPQCIKWHLNQNIFFH